MMAKPDQILAGLVRSDEIERAGGFSGKLCGPVLFACAGPNLWYGGDRKEEKMMADAYLPEWVYDLPASFVFQPDGQMRELVARARDIGVVKVIAGPERCHIRVDIRRPYYRALPVPA